MTSVSNVGSHTQAAAAAAANNARAVQSALAALRRSFNPTGNLDKDLFKQLDSNSDGILTQAELETAVTAAGGTKQAADALYAQLDPKKTGSVTEAQFAERIGGSRSSRDAGALTALSKTISPSTQLLQNLFTKLDKNGDGSLSKSELEAAVTAAGGTQADADALYSQLDRNNTGAVTTQQFSANLKPAERSNFVTSLIV